MEANFSIRNASHPNTCYIFFQKLLSLVLILVKSGMCLFISDFQIQTSGVEIEYSENGRLKNLQNDELLQLQVPARPIYHG